VADGETNAELTAQPMLYLYGCLFEAAIWAQDNELAASRLEVYLGEVADLNVQGSNVNAGDTPTMGI